MPDKIRILFLGDVIGRPGRKILKALLPGLREKHKPDLIIANGENSAGGLGITPEVGRELFGLVDILTSGNHVWDKQEGVPYLDEEARILRPANYPPGTPGQGSICLETKPGVRIGILNLQGRVFMEPVDCPFRSADEEIEQLRRHTPVILVDFHAEATSEKAAMGWYLTGRVSAVVGTHTHIPTADERILPGGTAYITDIGMVGARDSVIGIRKEQAIKRFLTSRPQRFEPSKEGTCLSSLIVDIHPRTGRSISVFRDLLVEPHHG